MVTDDMLDRHAAQGVIAADRLQRGEFANEPAAIKAVMSMSGAMARTDGIDDKGIAGFLAMAGICHFHMRRMDATGGAL